jgi:nitroreductase
MEVQEAIRTVLSVRKYTDKPVPDDVIRQVLEAGRLTASGGNDQRWTFIVVQDRAKLEELAAASPSGPYTAHAAFAVVVVTDDNAFGTSDASRAIQNMTLAGWSLGLGSVWVGFPKMLTQINPLLGIPEDKVVAAILPFGYPADPSLGKGVKKRKPFDEVVHWGGWGGKATS